MQTELKAAKPELNIEILGVNRMDESLYNYLITDVSSLPWLQDTAQDSVWSQWEVVWRDVKIVDSQNRLRGVFNLTTHDLSRPTNYLALKQMFLEAARVVDSDQDGLPDDWERRYFANLASGPSDDPDGDGHDNFAELAFGTNPTNASSFFTPHPTVTFRGADGFVTLSFHRPAGSVLDYSIQASPDLREWTQNAAEVGPAQNPRTLFDGTGTMEVFYSLRKPTRLRPTGFLRVQVIPKPQP